uniref:Uncharacterized protein n=1 Tax=Chromera velia CCMP2878 TaxID=1169474 RepID=A0A0G4GWV4_9ALVE|eukprot:Cvel_5315.t1-p1 / transcript=Cvel_5315.t1 / gene=Cvel_5315 / organism=Chromera_velia_CCMP2878 / gene_product=hypothetical protein / transcript_product=hypothetical protein / location=Cvel_scaffold246:55089-63205(-) / protein_length=888 / sequence_SO=supercontig / SO=protein_coding / is_pseudo=false
MIGKAVTTLLASTSLNIAFAQDAGSAFSVSDLKAVSCGLANQRGGCYMATGSGSFTPSTMLTVEKIPSPLPEGLTTAPGAPLSEALQIALTQITPEPLCDVNAPEGCEAYVEQEGVTLFASNEDTTCALLSLPTYFAGVCSTPHSPVVTKLAGSLDTTGDYAVLVTLESEDATLKLPLENIAIAKLEAATRMQQRGELPAEGITTTTVVSEEAPTAGGFTPANASCSSTPCVARGTHSKAGVREGGLRDRMTGPALHQTEFSLDAGKLGLLLSSLPAGPDFLETLKGGPHVCKGPCLSVLNRFFRGAASASLKTLNLSKCDMSDSAGGTLLHSLPPSLEYLDVGENRLRSLSMEALRFAFSEGTLSKLLGLDVSNNPLGPSGVATLARGLSASKGALPLQSLKLSKTTAKAEGVKALSAPLKEGKTPSLQVLDLGGNDMMAEGVGGLAGAVGAGTLSSLRVLILKENCLARKSKGGEWNFSSLTALFSHQFPALQELDVSYNQLEGSDDADTAAPMVGEAFGGGRLPSVQRLNLSGTDMRQADVTAVCTAVCSALETGSVPSLTALHLCGVDVSAGQALAAALDSDRLPELKELVVNEDLFSPGIGVVTRSIASGKALALSVLKMDIAFPTHADDISSHIWGGLVEGLTGGGLESLEDLDLFFENGKDDIIPSGRIREFARALGTGGLSSLRRLSLHWSEGGLGVGSLSPEVAVKFHLSDLPDAAVKAVAAIIRARKVPGLRNFQLESWGVRNIAEGAARDLGEALVHVGGEGGEAPSLSSHALEELYINCDVFEEEKGVSALFNAIASGGGFLPSLHSIRITRLLPGDTPPAAPPLAECIVKGKFPKLQNLYFSSVFTAMCLGQEGMQALSRALCSPYAKSLRSLTL